MLANAGVGAFSESMGGLYVGMTKLKEKLFLRRDLPQALLTWDEADKWAKSLGENVFLPSTEEALMLMGRLPEHIAQELPMWTELKYEGGISRALTYICKRISNGDFSQRTTAARPATKLHARAVVRIETADRLRRK